MCPHHLPRIIISEAHKGIQLSEEHRRRADCGFFFQGMFYYIKMKKIMSDFKYNITKFYSCLSL